MPNWCDNSVEVKGPSDFINQLMKDLRSDNFFNSIVPQPKNIEDWYWWRVNNWGTKWGLHADEVYASTEDLGEKYKRLSADFCTAWSPPIPVYRVLNNMLMDLFECPVLAYWSEMGNAFCGKYECGSEIEIDLSDSLEVVKQTIPEDLDEHFGITSFLEEQQEENQS